MKIFDLFKNEELPYIESYYTYSTIRDGYVVVISKDSMLHSRDVNHSHDLALEQMLYQMDPTFHGLVPNHRKITWEIKQNEGYVLIRFTKIDAIIYLPTNLSDYQIDVLKDIVNQIKKYEKKKKNKVGIVLSDLEQGELLLSTDEFSDYLDTIKNNLIIKRGIK